MARFRLLLRTFAAASAATALAPALAQAWMPEPVQFTRAVEVRPGSAVTEITTARRFDMAALEWRGAPRAHAELRVPDGRGGWTRWAHSDAQHDGPDAGTEAEGAGRTAGSPVWTGSRRRIQIRVSRPLRGLRVRFANTTGSATAERRAATRAETAKRGAFGARSLPATSVGTPAVVPRRSWGASRCRPRVAPSYGEVKVAYVHHTVSLNGYSASRAASMVLGICLFHRNGNGWNDIGYDFLVDRFGRVYEGRAGGVDAPVIGAHAGGFNGESTGVAVLGTHSSSAPSASAMGSLARLLAWKLSIHGVGARGRVRVTSEGGPSTRHRAGARVAVRRISGHRDVGLTSCPGAALYARLPGLRRRVARLQGGVSRLGLAVAASEVPYGSGVHVTGRLDVPEGASAEGAPIELRRFARGRETLLTTATAAADGTWAAELPPLERSQFVRAVFPGDDGRPGAVSQLAHIAVVPRIELEVAPAAAFAGSPVTARGTIAPAKRRVRVTALLAAEDGTEHPVASRRTAARDGTFATRLVLPRAGTYRIVATAAAGRRSAAGRSAPATVHVLPHP